MGKAGGQRWVSGSATANRLQAKALQETALAENCILVDEHDRAIGQSTKRDCHRVDENGHIKLHRAFSVFLFNSNGDMLIQKRSSHKVRHTGIYSQRNLHHFKATAVFSIDFFVFFLFFAFLQSSFIHLTPLIRRLPSRIATQMPVAAIHCTILNGKETKRMQWAFEKPLNDD